MADPKATLAEKAKSIKRELELDDNLTIVQTVDAACTLLEEPKPTGSIAQQINHLFYNSLSKVDADAAGMASAGKATAAGACSEVPLTGSSSAPAQGVPPAAVPPHVPPPRQGPRGPAAAPLTSHSTVAAAAASRAAAVKGAAPESTYAAAAEAKAAKEDTARYDALRIKPAGDLTMAEFQELPGLKERVEKRQREDADRASKAARRGGAESKPVVLKVRILLPGAGLGDFSLSHEYSTSGAPPDTPLEMKGTLEAAVADVLQQHKDFEGDEAVFAAADAILVSGGARMGRHWADKPSYMGKRVDQLTLKEGEGKAKADVKYFIAPMSEREHVEGWLRDHGYIAGGTPDAVRTRPDRVSPSDEEPEAEADVKLGRKGGKGGLAKAAAVQGRSRAETLYDAYARDLRAVASHTSKEVSSKWNALKLEGQIAWGRGRYPALTAKYARGPIKNLEKLSQPIPEWLSSAAAAAASPVELGAASSLAALASVPTSADAMAPEEDCVDDGRDAAEETGDDAPPVETRDTQDTRRRETHTAGRDARHAPPVETRDTRRRSRRETHTAG
jgi:hypothetical protein